MNEYARNLRSLTNTWSAAYIAFETGYHREEFRAYAFVEDEDDKIFYQLALTNYDDIRYLGCGGRSGVLSIYEKLKSEGKSERGLFFIDRDTEIEPFLHRDDVLRTTFYSWESHICQPEFVGWLLQRKTNPNLTPSERSDVEGGWRSTVQAYHRILATHTALCQTAFILGESLDISSVVAGLGAKVHNSILTPADDDPDYWYPSRLGRAEELGADPKDIENRMTYYLNSDPFVTSQGKFLFGILRRFVSMSLRRFDVIFQGEFNSPKHWLVELPWTHRCMDYIREYTQARIGSA